MQRWELGQPGVLALPSGRLVRGRGLRSGLPVGPPPEFTLYLQAKPPRPTVPLLITPPPAGGNVELGPQWPVRWVRWPDFRLPVDRDVARDAFLEVWTRALDSRVEVACNGGRGRTGTALACIAVIDGVPAERAVAYVRQHYHPRAVETPWQRGYVRSFSR